MYPCEAAGYNFDIQTEEVRMQQVITSKRAKEITGGRKPLEIVPYELAVKALRECLEFDDVKYWDNLADAYTAWGKIHHSEEVIRLARALKLKAAQRLGELAIKLRPRKSLGQGKGTTPGAVSLLVEQGMTKSQATLATRFARNPKVVDMAAKSSNPPTPGTLNTLMGQNQWTLFRYRSGWGSFINHCHKSDARNTAKLVREAMDVDKVKQDAMFIYEWLDEFIQHLPKEKTT